MMRLWFVREARRVFQTSFRRWSHAPSEADLKDAKGLWGAYVRANVKYPVPTAVLTSAVLWTAGDVVAQKMEETKDSKGLDVRRLAATSSEGSLVGGGIGYFWYNFLDRIVSNVMKLEHGTVRFVVAKLGLEFALWHPVSLLSFWLWVGLAEGHSIAKITEELKSDYFPTLLSEYCLWAPLDLFNFWKVPVHLQVIVSNAGCFVEAVGLSYIHEHGFPGFAPKDDPVIRDVSSVSTRMPHLSFVESMTTTLLEPVTMSRASEDFDSVDKTKRGYLDVQQVREIMVDKRLPGINDPTASARAAELLLRKADINGDGRVSKKEYLALVKELHRARFRESLLSDVALALFDGDGDGKLDTNELKNFAVVLLNVDAKEAASVAALALKQLDTDGDGRLSREELRNAFGPFVRAARQARIEAESAKSR
mmetsp:Transcript_63912/g.171224  ORF Transcript_63912/g.171224 Transcript_63912/m.171224 type:complete len:423 (-) Transcript_63912:27-1295(-)